MYQLVLGRIHEKAVVPQKIDTDDGELYIGREECEGEAPAAEGQRHRLLAPALDGQTIGAEQLGA
jgi:hypothetical protein